MVLNEKKEILLVRNRKRGWEFPGGFVETGETIKEAAVRETKEETGIDIAITQFCGLEQNIFYSTLVVVFQGEMIGGELEQSDESIDIGFFSIDSAENMITWASFKERLNRCLNGKEKPFII